MLSSSYNAVKFLPHSTAIDPRKILKMFLIHFFVLLGLSLVLAAAENTTSTATLTSTTILSFITSTITSTIQYSNSTTSRHSGRISTSTVVLPPHTVTVTSHRHTSTVTPDSHPPINDFHYPILTPQSAHHHIARQASPMNDTLPNWCYQTRPYLKGVPIVQYEVKLTTNNIPSELCGGLWDNLKGHGLCLAPVQPLSCGGIMVPGQTIVTEGEAMYVTRWTFMIGLFCDASHIQGVIRAALSDRRVTVKPVDPEEYKCNGPAE